MEELLGWLDGESEVNVGLRLTARDSPSQLGLLTGAVNSEFTLR